MSNYLQSKWKLLSQYTVLCLATGPVFATDPQNDAANHQAHTINIQAQSDKTRWTEAHGQIDKLYKSLSTNPNILKTKQSLSTQFNDIRQQGVNKLTNLTKDLIYEPEHPEKLIDLLITGYTFVINVEKPVVTYGEQYLGNKNQFVIETKEKCSEHLQYLDALKQQREMLVRSVKRDKL